MNRTFFFCYLFCLFGSVPRLALGAEESDAGLQFSIPESRTQIAHGISVFLVLGVAFSVVLWYSTKRLRKKNGQLDAANAKSRDGIRAATEITKNTSPLRALVVDDIDYNAAAMQAMLRKLGIEPDAAYDGLTALAHLQDSFYDLLFIDWDLSGLSGVEVVTRFRATEARGRRTMVVAITAGSTDLDYDPRLGPGMDAFVTRPFNVEKISAALHRLRGSLRPAASTEPIDPVKQLVPVPGIDLRVLKFLSKDSAEGLDKQIDRYLGFFDSDRSAARKIIAGGNVREIHRIAHRLAGHASMVSFQPLMSLASELQAHASGGDQVKLRELLGEFDREFARFRSKLESFRVSTGLV